ncbi:unnamed protein product [Didymodactylos carnosus]|uniref:Uncharacterized protein n=1 Tax=Didymodactylos carnosus TaxID=1234261 RepID=A0A815W0B0_9BILA|nr:unnamed protein product [Didymodactylos carnosus]CAF1539630.1 unnamed protein product [Didymodactylos carnosus]CAF4250691.1 unnamed protein product [Didymodactylos carnosus]CAF4399819.1 unnamed protein product [Didymodactylos carnosus]
MIPCNLSLEKVWYEFEGGSCYEYAHGEIPTKPARNNVVKNKSSTQETKVDSKKHDEKAGGTDDSPINRKQYREDLTKLETSMTEIKVDLNEVLSKLKKLTSNNDKDIKTVLTEV